MKKRLSFPVSVLLLSLVPGPFHSLPVAPWAGTLLFAQTQTSPPASTEDAEKKEEAERRAKIATLMQQVFATEDLKEKERIYKQILEIDPYHTGAVQGLIEVQRKIKEEEQAKSQRQVTKTRKEEAIEKARDAYLAGRLQLAGTAVDEALKIDPEDPEAKNLKARIDNELRNEKMKYLALWIALGVLVVGLVVVLVIFLRKKAGVLEVIEGPEPGRLLPLDHETTTLGSLETEVDFAIVSPSRRISRKHCSILKSGKHYFLTDHSTNGTLVNGHPVPKGQPVLLQRGDQVSLAGDVTLLFRYK